MSVSVVIPTYRRPHLLKKCLDAMLAQNFDKNKYEVIVVSDGPDADTKNMLNDLAWGNEMQLRYLPAPQKKGPAAARNYGWRNAKYDIIAFTDDDCIPDANWLSEIVRQFEPDTSIAITGKVIVPIKERPTDYELNTANLEKADFITANCACSKAALEKAGGFDEDFGMAWREDSDLHFKLLKNDIPIKKVTAAKVVHPVRHCAWGVSIKEQKKTMYDALLYKKYPKLFRKKIRPVSPVLYYAIIAAFVVIVAGLVQNKHMVTVTGLVAWLTFTTYFIYKRLSATSLAIDHVIEMIATSIIIPFASVYWQWYGAVKYRVLFI